MQRIAERSDCRIAALHQRSAENAILALNKLGLDPQLYAADFNSMIADPAVEAVFLCSPNSSHGPQSIAALEAGKHVFCEKPCATLHDDFLRQLQLARENPQLVTYVTI